MTPRLEIVKLPPCISATVSFPARAFSDKLAQLPCNLVNILAIRITHHRHDEAVRRVRGEPHMNVLFQNQVGALWIERGVEQGELLQGFDACAHDKCQRSEFDTGLQCFLFQLGTRILEVGDIRLIELRDVWDVYPARMQSRPGDLLNPRQRLGLDFADTARNR